jgi:hypothetical protein
MFADVAPELRIDPWGSTVIWLFTVEGVVDGWMVAGASVPG